MFSIPMEHQIDLEFLLFRVIHSWTFLHFTFLFVIYTENKLWNLKGFVLTNFSLPSSKCPAALRLLTSRLSFLTNSESGHLARIHGI